MFFTVGLEVTKRCNFTCEHCMVDAGKPHPQEMDTEQMKALIDDLADCGANRLAWSGGEPLLRKDLEELCAHAALRGLTSGLASNGFLVTEERLSLLSQLGLTVVQISLDGTTAELAHRYRKGPRSAFDRAVRAVRICVSLGLTTYVCSLLSPETAAEVDEMIDFARALGARGLRYTMWAPVGRAGGEAYDEQAWGRPEVARFFEVVVATDSPDFRVLVDCPTGPYPGRERYRCSAGVASTYITSNGDVYPCTALMVPEYLIGNLRQRPVRELLYGAGMFKVQRELAQNLPGRACEDCSAVSTCRGGCPGRTIAAFGSLTADGSRIGMPACLLRLHRRT